MSADRRPILYSNEMSDSEIPEFYELSPSKRPRSQGLCPSLPVSYGPPVYHAQTTDVRDESLYEVKGAPESRWSLSTLGMFWTLQSIYEPTNFFRYEVDPKPINRRLQGLESPRRSQDSLPISRPCGSKSEGQVNPK